MPGTPTNLARAYRGLDQDRLEQKPANHSHWLRELERLISVRHGSVLPDNREGIELFKIVAHHIAHAGADAARHIAAWRACGRTGCHPTRRRVSQPILSRDR